jgi:hypothetical protein
VVLDHPVSAVAVWVVSALGSASEASVVVAGVALAAEVVTAAVLAAEVADATDTKEAACRVKLRLPGA